MKHTTGLIFLALLFLGIYFQVFFADYAYLDEIHQLWHNSDGSNYTMFMTSGRWLTGLLFDKLFARIHTIQDIKWLRIFSLGGWLVFIFSWQYFFTRWVRQLNIDARQILLMNFYLICSIPVAIYIGWASCMEMFLGAGAGLISGHLLFSGLTHDKVSGKLPVIQWIASLLTGLISLFIYQNMFGFFLFPFFLYYLQYPGKKPGRVLVGGIMFYLLLYGVYYVLFKFSLRLDGLTVNNRAGVSTDLMGKISFLVSDVLPSAFSVNFLYTARSIFSQVLAPLMMATWLIAVFIRYGRRRAGAAFMHILIVLGFLVAIYLPSMIALENFASYRTLLVVNLAVFYLLTSELFSFCKPAWAKRALYGCCLLLLATGFYNYNFQFLAPLKAEHRAFITFMNKQSYRDLKTVYFIRADRFLFKSAYHVLPYKDEFGVPSTSKDWVPEPLVKQYLFERTGDRDLAEKIQVVQFEDSAAYSNAGLKDLAGGLLIDMNKIFGDYVKTGD